MTEYIVYHNPDVMGYPAAQVIRPEIVTNHAVKESIVGRVWLVTGEGKPRSFFLRLHFMIDSISSGDDVGFRTRVSGSHEHLFDPMINLDGEEWFSQLKRETGNFSFGFRPIRNQSVIDGLRKVAGISAQAASSH